MFNLQQWIVKQALDTISKDIQKNGLKNAKTLDAIRNFNIGDNKSNKKAVAQVKKAAKSMAKTGSKDMVKEPEETKLRGSQGWNDKSLELGPSSGEKFALDFLLPVIGDVVGFAGNAYGTYNTALAAALAALAANKPKRESGIFGNSRRELIGPMAAALGARGAISKLAGDTAANRAYTYSDAQKLENDAARRAALAINEHGVVPASYYNTQSEMTKTKSRGKQE